MNRTITAAQWILNKGEYVLAVIGVMLGAWMAYHVFTIGLLRVLTDQNAHLNFAKLATDSLTPGISQLGFWPPLLHILMVPFVLYEEFYQTGLAGFVVLLPFLILGSIFLYKILLLLGGGKLISLTGGIVFLVNPYVLYYTVTPMMEVLFLANLLGVAYFFTRWMQEQKLWLLACSALFVILTSISRYEGFILIPLGVFLVVLYLWQQKTPYKQIEASAILFLWISMWGVVVVMLYSWIYGGTPFAFTGGWWIRDPENFPTQHNIVSSIQYLLHASFYVIGKPVVIAALASIIPLAVFFRGRMQAAAPLLILLSPFLMITLALFRGFPPIMVPELAPFGLFFNERYGLTWIGFAIAAPLVLASYVKERSIFRMRVVSMSFVGIVCVGFLVFSGTHFLQKVFFEDFQEIRGNLSVNDQDVAKLNAVLAQEYDYGKVLVTRTINDSLITHLNIPLKNFIHEANYLYYQQTMEEPWFFARWVVMYNPEGDDPWSNANEPIKKRWGVSEVFHEYYEVVFATRSRRIYKVKDSAIEKFAQQNGYVFEKIPSVNPSITTWDPAQVYENMQLAEQNKKQVRTEDNTL